MDCVRWDVGYRPITPLELEWHRQRNGAATDIAFSLKVDYFRFWPLWKWPTIRELVGSVDTATLSFCSGLVS
jgi:hypothetical protein